jgi:hypothetical protein
MLVSSAADLLEPWPLKIIFDYVIERKPAPAWLTQWSLISMEGRSTITIAHRLASARRADVIFVLEGGTIAERGAHDELLARSGLYSNLRHIQSQAHRRQASPDAAPGNSH